MAQSAGIADLRSSLRRQNVMIKLIIANVAVFLLLHLLSFAFLVARVDFSPARWLVLPGDFLSLLLSPWTIVTYMFVHTDFLHILANMLWLYCFGFIFLELYSERQMLKVYFVGGLAGALSFLIASLIVPSPGLMGASAAVMAVAAAAVVTRPDYSVRFWLVGSVKIKWVALFFVAFALLTTRLDYSAVTAHASHLGGIAVGVVFALYRKFGAHLITRRRKKGIILPPLHREKCGFDEQRLDELLDRVRVSGYNSLSKAERDELNEISKKIKR